MAQQSGHERRARFGAANHNAHRVGNVAMLHHLQLLGSEIDQHITIAEIGRELLCPDNIGVENPQIMRRPEIERRDHRPIDNHRFRKPVHLPEQPHARGHFRIKAVTLRQAQPLPQKGDTAAAVTFPQIRSGRYGNVRKAGPACRIGLPRRHQRAGDIVLCRDGGIALARRQLPFEQKLRIARFNIEHLRIVPDRLGMGGRGRCQQPEGCACKESLEQLLAQALPRLTRARPLPARQLHASD